VQRFQGLNAYIILDFPQRFGGLERVDNLRLSFTVWFKFDWTKMKTTNIDESHSSDKDYKLRGTLVNTRTVIRCSSCITCFSSTLVFKRLKITFAKHVLYRII
jgi:hypothetical protein